MVQEKAFSALLNLNSEDAAKMDFIANINRTAVTQKRWQAEVRSKLDTKLKNPEESVTKKKASKIQLSW